MSFKLELLQHAGSFKTRGAFANLLLRDIPSAGVVAASGGNHGAAVAYAAMKLGITAKIFVPNISSPAKIQRIHDYGAELVVGGDRYADALAASEAWSAQSGALPVHAFDQRETLLGQGTIGLELESQLADLDTLLVGVGGGGLIGGIAAWYQRSISVVGVEPEASPTLTTALAAGRPVDAEASGIAATPSRRVASASGSFRSQNASWNASSSFPTTRSDMPRKPFGRRCGSLLNRVAPRRSRRCCQVATDLARTSMSAWSSAAAIQLPCVSIIEQAQESRCRTSLKHEKSREQWPTAPAQLQEMAGVVDCAGCGPDRRAHSNLIAPQDPAGSGFRRKRTEFSVVLCPLSTIRLHSCCAQDYWTQMQTLGIANVGLANAVKVAFCPDRRATVRDAAFR